VKENTLKHSVAFIICSEKGELEKKSLLFAKSLRNFGGVLKDAPIYSVAPRKGKNISEKTLNIFRELNVNHQYLNLNTKYSTYAFANKIEACTYFEKQLTEDLLIFCDSDQLILGGLDELLLKDESLAMQYVAIKGIGSNGKDNNAEYWKELYKLTNVKTQHYITLPDNQQILQYFNSGLIVVKRNLGLFKKWNKNFDLVMQSQLIPTKGDFFSEQSVLSATISAMEISVKVLPKSYNFHLLNHTNLDEALQKIENGEIRMLHYHNTFDFPNKIILPEGFYLRKNSSKLNWINMELNNCGVNKKLLMTPLEETFDLNKKELESLFKKKK
jgi:hypothetical protein